jgi:hypothetical protein
MKHTYMETRADDRKLTKHDKNETMCLHPTCRYALVADPLCGCTIHFAPSPCHQVDATDGKGPLDSSAVEAIIGSFLDLDCAWFHAFHLDIKQACIPSGKQT